MANVNPGIISPREYGHFIDGSWREPASAARIDVVNPATGELLARVPAGDSSDVDAAVAAAGKAFGKWGRSSPGERQRILLEIAARIERRAIDFALLETRNVGKPIREFQVCLGYDLVGRQIETNKRHELCFVHRYSLL